VDEGKYKDLRGEHRKNEIQHMKVSLIGKRNIFKQQSSYNESINYSTYLVAEIIAKEGKPFTDSDLRRVFRKI
jgi:hypothetical protein